MARSLLKDTWYKDIPEDELKFPYFYDMEFLRKQSSKELFNVVSMFAGGGGSSTGYRLAGGKVLAINEFVESARNTYSKNYPDTHIFPQDIRELTGQMILDQLGLKRGELDILDGSPPCASFSTINGKYQFAKNKEERSKARHYSEGIEQRTDDLFFEFIRILDELQPKVFVAENVRGLAVEPNLQLLGSNDPNDNREDTIMYIFRSLGYKVKYKLINAEDYGVPQTRTRLIIIGVRKDIKGMPSFPKEFDTKVTLKDVLPDMEFISCKKGFSEEFNRMRLPKDVCYTVTTGGIGPKADYRIFRKGMTLEMIPEKDRESFYTYDDLPMHEVPDLHKEGYLAKKDFSGVEYKEHEDYKKLCKMTIPEFKKICSFPSDYYLDGSYNQQLERLGRSVPPLLLKAVARNIYYKILKPYNEQ
jgi:DNA (cytosine-5)-methyltransferase 1